MRTCVPGRPVLLLNPGAVLASGAWDGTDDQWLPWVAEAGAPAGRLGCVGLAGR
jgi:hypothetical protein